MMTRSLVPAALLLLGCRLHHRPVEPEPPRWPVRDSLYALDQSRGDSVATRGAVSGTLSLLDSNVVFLRAGQPLTFTRRAVWAMIESSRAMLPYVWQPLGGGVSKDLSSGYTFGIAARSNSQTPKVERYLAFWQRRTRSEPWRIVAYAEISGSSAADVKLTESDVSLPDRRLSRRAAEATFRLAVSDSMFSDLADRMGLPYAFANTTARYGAVFNSTRLIVGPEALSELFATQSRGTSVTWRPVYVSVAGSNDLGFTVGEYITTGPGPSGAAIQRFGKYLSVWQREPDGKWKLVMSSGNATPRRTNQ